MLFRSASSSNSASRAVADSRSARSDSANTEAETSRAEIVAAFGAAHPLTALPLSVLAEAACARGEFERCLELSEQAAAVRVTARTAADHPTFIPKHLAAAIALRGLGRTAEAEARFDEAEAIARKAGDAWLGRVLAERGGLERAAEAVRLLTQQEGAEHPDTRRARRAFAQALLDAGRSAEAERAFAELASSGEPKSPLRGAVLLGQARALMAQGRAGEAEPLLRLAVMVAGDEDPQVTAARDLLRTGKP